MTRLKCLILDDREDDIHSIQTKLHKYFKDIEVLAVIQEPDNAIGSINETNPDLVFLDIQMADIDGFELLRKVEKTNFEVIFTTNDSDAIKAFEYSSLTYLLKPITDKLFIAAVNKSLERISKRVQLKPNGSADEKNSNLTKKIAIPTSDGYVIKKIAEIIRIESKDRYAVIFFLDKTKFVSSYNIGKYKEMLVQYSFIQSHKSHIVNKEHIKEYHNSGYLVLSNGHQVPIATSRRKDVLNHIKSFS